MKRIAFITKNHTNPAYGGALIGARSVATREGLEIEHSAPGTPDDVGEQSALVRAAIQREPSAIVLLPAHATALGQAIAEINEAGIPLFLIVSKPDSGHWVSYIGTDSEQMAFSLGVRLLRELTPGSRVAIIDGHPESITTPERHRGFAEAVSHFPGIRHVDSVSGFYQRAEGRDAAVSLLRRHVRLDGLLVSNDLMAMGALEAMNAAGRRIPMVSINGTPDAIAAVRRGDLLATASFNTHRFGCLAVEAVARHLSGLHVPAEIVLPADIIDSGNAMQWDKPYELRDPPDWEGFARRFGTCTHTHGEGSED